MVNRLVGDHTVWVGGRVNFNSHVGASLQLGKYVEQEGRDVLRGGQLEHSPEQVGPTLGSRSPHWIQARTLVDPGDGQVRVLTPAQRVLRT